jgi:NAD-dependent DNA ligase
LKEAKKNRSFFKVGTKMEKPFEGVRPEEGRGWEAGGRRERGGREAGGRREVGGGRREAGDRGRREGIVREAGGKPNSIFSGFTIALGGKLSQSVAKLQALIEELGGTYSSKVTIHVTHCIATEKQCAKLPKNGNEVKGKGKLDLSIKVFFFGVF